MDNADRDFLDDLFDRLTKCINEERRGLSTNIGNLAGGIAELNKKADRVIKLLEKGK